VQRHDMIPAGRSMQPALVSLPFFDGGAGGATTLEISLALLIFALAAIA
jgi:hypothetical protein